MDQVFAIKAVFALMLLAGVRTAGAQCDHADCTQFTDDSGACTVDPNDNTCTCVPENLQICTCADGYEDGTTACQLSAPAVKVGEATNTATVAYKGSLTLTCEPVPESESAVVNDGYIWTVGVTPETDQTNTYTLTSVTAETTTVTCAVTDSTGTLTSADSSDFLVTLQETAVNCQDENTLCVDAGYTTGSCSISSTLSCSCASVGTCTVECKEITACATTGGFTEGTCTITNGVCSCASGETCTATCNAAAPCTVAEFNGAQTCSISATGICTCGANDCTCGDGYTLNPTSKTCFALGKPCTEATKSVDCDGDKYTGVCTSSRCVCANGREQITGDCSGAAAMAGSLLLLALTTVMSRFF